MTEIPNIARSIAIIGGGITGLATAYYLEKHARESGESLEITLLEQGSQLGGKIVTEHVPGYGMEDFVVEGGPDSFLTQKPWALQLAREIGLEDRLLGTNDEKRKVFVLNKGRPTPLPDGVLLIVPTKFMPFALSPLISPLGKLRMGMDLFTPARKDDEDETLADFIRRRLGEEALDKIAEPLMSGIYNAEAERQSLMATFPRFRDIEKKHGSLIRGMLAARTRRSSTHASAQSANGAKPPVSMFVSLRGGTQELVDTLAQKLRCHVELNTSVTALQRDQNTGQYRLTLESDSEIHADVVVLATPSFAAAKLLATTAPESATLLDEIRYVTTGTLSLAYRADQIEHPLDGFGLVIPRSENRPINAVTWSSTKFHHRAPEGYVLLRVFFGGSRNPQILDKSDEELVSIARSELKQLMAIDATPLFHRLYRWRDATAQYDVGHLDHVAAIEAALPPGTWVTGSPYRGIGIPDCVHQAQQTAASIVSWLAEPSSQFVTQ